MPRSTRWFLRAAFVWLLIGLGLWTLMALREVMNLPVELGLLRPTAIHAITVGFLTQMVFGVAIWLLPRPRVAGWVHGGELDVAVLIALNAGMLVRVIAEPPIVDVPLATLLLPIAAILQWLAAAGFVLRAWPRVRGK